MNLTAKTVRGIGWAGISQALRLLLQFGVTAILARLLNPNEFGLIGMITVFINFLVIFSDFGLTSALIQRKELVKEHLSSSFWLNVGAGFILSILTIGIAPLIANLYNESRLLPITMALGSTFFISSFGIVQMAIFSRNMNFKIISIIEITSAAISGIAAVFIAFAGFGVWSLVWQQIILSSVVVLLLWFFSPWKPTFSFRWKKVKELLNYGLNLTGFNILNYFNRNLDSLLIGKMLGAASLGFYSLAYRLFLFPVYTIASTIGRVIFPSLSIIQENKSSVSYAYLRTTRYIAMITFPLMIGLSILASEFVFTVFGDQWGPSVILVRVLAIVGLIQSITTTAGWIYQSQGRTDILLRWQIFSVIIVAASFIIGIHWNVEGITIAYAITQVILTYPTFAISFRLINLKVTVLFKQLSSIILATLGMGIIIFGMRFFLISYLKQDDLIVLIVCIFIGIISYTVLLLLVNRNLFHEIVELTSHLKATKYKEELKPNYSLNPNKTK